MGPWAQPQAKMPGRVVSMGWDVPVLKNPNGDLLVMPPGTQQRWEHSVPRRKNATGERVNLTFRQTIGAHPLRKGPKGRGVAR